MWHNPEMKMDNYHCLPYFWKRYLNVMHNFQGEHPKENFGDIHSLK